MLNHVYSNRPELYNYTHCAYVKPSYIFYGSSVIMAEVGTQQGDPEVPPLFAETNHTLVKQLESKTNIWFLDDGNLADNYKVVLRDLKIILKSEQIYGLSLNTEKCELCFLQNDFLERYDKLVRNSLCKVTNVKMNDNQFLQAVVPAAKGSLVVSSARLPASPAFTASAVGAKDALSEIFGLEPMMLRLNGGLNLEKLKWLRKMKSKKIGRSQFLTAKLPT